MAILLHRLASQGAYAVSDGQSPARSLLSDPLAVPRDQWRLGETVPLDGARLLAPVSPGKIVGVGRNYVEHARELGNPMPEEPLLFLKAPSAVVGPQNAVVLPPESSRVEHEGEIAVVLGKRLRRAGAEEAAGVPRSPGRRGARLVRPGVPDALRQRPGRAVHPGDLQRRGARCRPE